MTEWNLIFTQLIRTSRPTYWGNWGLVPDIHPGAVGKVDQGTGNFELVEDCVPGVNWTGKVRDPDLEGKQ